MKTSIRNRCRWTINTDTVFINHYPLPICSLLFKGQLVFIFFIFYFIFFSVRLLSVLRGHSSFHPRHNDQWPPTSKDFLSHILSITFIFLSLFLRKSQYFPFWMFSAKQGHYWYHVYNVFGMTRSLTGDWNRDLPHSKPALYH